MWNITCRQTVGNSCVGWRLGSASKEFKQPHRSDLIFNRNILRHSELDRKLYWLQLFFNFSLWYTCWMTASLPTIHLYNKSFTMYTWSYFTSNLSQANWASIACFLLWKWTSFREHRRHSTKIRVVPFCIGAFEQSCTIHKGPEQHPWAKSHALIPDLT